MMVSKKKNISTTKFTINIITERKLTEEQKDLMMNDIAARLHGYRTEPLLFLHGANINISRTTKKSNIITKLTKFISTTNDICKCEKPWNVNGICIVCEKPIKIN